MQDGQCKETAWSSVPDVPIRYHFYFRLLDGDDQGRPGRIENKDTGKWETNEEFDWSSQSALTLLTNSPHCQVCTGCGKCSLKSKCARHLIGHSS